MVTRAELDAARRELEETNLKLGYPRRASQDSLRRGIGGPTENVPSPELPASANSANSSPEGGAAEATPKDPGPPRFLALDVENKLAQLAGGAIIPVGDEDVRTCVGALLHSLRTHMARSYEAVADSHKVKASAQLEIPFGEPSGNSS